MSPQDLTTLSNNQTIAALAGTVVGVILTVLVTIVTQLIRSKAENRKERKSLFQQLIGAVNLFKLRGLKQAHFDAIVNYHSLRAEIFRFKIFMSSHPTRSMEQKYEKELEQINKALDQSRDYARLCDEVRAHIEELLFALKQVGVNVEGIVMKILAMSIKFTSRPEDEGLEGVESMYKKSLSDIEKINQRFGRLQDELKIAYRH